MYDYILVDSNNWYHKNYATHQLDVYQIGNRSIATGGIKGFLFSFLSWKKKFAHKNTLFYFIFDNPTSKSNLRQLMIDPSYKENRKGRPKSFYRSIDYLRLILENYDHNIYCIYGTGYESDDIVPYILKKIPNDKKVLLMSEDMDWSRLISKNIHQYMKKEVYTFQKFQFKYGFEPTIEKVTMFKTIRGDIVDNIPIGIKGLPTKILIRLVDDFKDIYNLFDNLKIINYLSDKWKKEFALNRDRLILNFQLVSFFKIDEAFVDKCTIESKYRPEQLEILYNSLGFDLYNIDKRLYTYKRERDLIQEGFDIPYLRPPDIYMKRK